ncbi:MAG: NAD(P)-dependent oxidoreductase [Anaerolineae bacterium]|nr:NAD(P)-dependent oxidoreductase [Anaerolineae bacterium]
MAEIQTVGILSPGDMGHTVGRVLGENGLRVVAALDDRSVRTKRLAQEAQIEDVGGYEALVQQADLILSILVPAQAKAAAQRVAQAIRSTGANPLYADCNAIAPQTVREIGQIITSAGGRFVDAGIIGGPPARGKQSDTRFYAAGPDADTFALLDNFGLNVVVVGSEIGHASAIKMCYAALTKGTTALYTELLTAAQALGVYDALIAEFERSQSSALGRMRHMGGMPAKSRRWVGEMEEIARTFEHVGLTPKILAGAADMYRLVGSTALADRTPEDPQPPPSLEEMLTALAAVL